MVPMLPVSPPNSPPQRQTKVPYTPALVQEGQALNGFTKGLRLEKVEEGDPL